MIPRLFSETVNLLEKVMDVRGKRHELLISNITNQDTPGYEAKDLPFDEILKSSVGGGTTLNMAATDRRHLSSSGNGSSDFQGRIVTRENPGGYDGNSVNVEQEMALMGENSLMYDASAQIIGEKFRGLLYVIREGR